ncbi:Inositol-1,4,5-trisphosphate 5-phosphatase 1 [Venturia inaequalis]|nr:Inositol-1,4,5-trisphosphate 5-phosphatase 1 [Venturia inaequalis]
MPLTTRTTACLTSSAITEAVQNHHSLHEAALNSLLSASLRILANMVSVQPSRHSPDEIDVVITFRTQSSDIVFLSADVSNWTPQQMSWNGDAHEHVITVPRGTPSILYKFRIGENNWFHDGTVSAEPDGFFGWNNKFEIPEVPLPTPANDLDEDVDLESVAAVESIADTVSEFGTEGDTHSLFHDEDLIDRDEVIEDPDYAVYSQSQPSESSGSRFFGFGGSNRGVQYRL